MGRSEQRLGKAGEQRAATAVRVLGIEMVEQIGTPIKIVKTKKDKYGRIWYQVIWGEKVSGDTRGILPGGRSVLVETKTIMDRNLRYSDLRTHQGGRLTEHAEFGGLSLLVWVHDTGIKILKWPVSDFGPGKGLTPEVAERLEITDLSEV